jgi:hypothetical protein
MKTAWGNKWRELMRENAYLTDSQGLPILDYINCEAVVANFDEYVKEQEEELTKRLS